MADASFTQTSFNSGEWSLTAQGRFDLPQYRTAMNVCLNGIPLEEGAWTRAPGSLYETHTAGGTAGRLITWPFQQNLPYAIEFTAGVMRFHTGTRPAMTNDQQTVSAISTANPAKVTTGVHGWVTGNTVMVNTWGAVDPLVLNRQFVITVTSSTEFTLADAITNAGIDGSTLVAFVSGNVTRIAEVASPYTLTLLPSVRSVQAETKAVLLQGLVLPQLLTAVPPTSAADAVFSLKPAQFKDGPYLDPVVGATLTPASTSGIVGFTMASVTWSSTGVYNVGDFVVYSSASYRSLVDQNLNNTPGSATWAWVAANQNLVVGPNGLQESDLGRHIRLFSEPPLWAAGTTYSAGAPVKYQNAYFTSIVGTNTGNIPGVDITKWAITPKAAIWTWGKITSLTGAVATLVVPTSGTAIGSFSYRATAAFDGVTSQSYLQSANTPGEVATPNYIGKNFSGGQAVSYALAFGPSDRAMAIDTYNSPTQLTLKLYGKATAPSASNDGTLLGSQSFSATSPGQIVQIFSSDTSTSWNYLWVEWSTSGPTTDNFYCAELQFFTTTSFSGTGISVQIIGPPLLYTTAITTWRLGLFTSASGYPTCGSYHEGRLWLSGVVSNRVDASALVDIYGNSAVDLFTFTPTIFDQTVSAACAIDYTLNGPDVNAIYWIEPDLQGLIFGTQAGEWLAQATAANQPLSPLSMQAHRVTKIGCANILPRRTEHTLVFVQTYLTKIKEYFADIFSGKFTAPNLLEKAAHLGNRRLAELAYQKELSPIVWARCNDNSLIGASYKRDTLMTSQGPTFIGWFRRTLGSGRVVESIATGPTSTGNLETLGMITNDTGTNIRHVEFMTPNFTETQSGTTAWFLDDAIAATTTQGATVGGQLGMLCSGLWHLNGKTCTVFCGGFDCGDFAVANGACFVPYTNSGGIFTQAFAAAAAAVGVPASTGNDAFTKAMLHFDGTNGSTTITDSNSGGSAHTWTNHTGSIATAQSEFGGSSYNSGAGAGWVDTPDSTDFTLENGDFTIDSWVYRNGGDGTERMFGGQTNAALTDRTWVIELSTGNVFIASVSSNGATGTVVIGTTTITTTGWHHVALVRTGNILKLFVDGTQEGGDVSFTGSVHDSASNLAVGRYGELTTTPWNGYIDEFRISVGFARWTSNFTPPTAPAATITAASAQVIVGFTYTSDAQLLRPVTPQDTGARDGPGFAKRRRIHQVGLQVVATQGLSFGTSFSALTPAAFKTPGGTPYAVNALFSGIFRDTVPDVSAGEGYDSMICWRATRPYPACVVVVGGFIHTSDA